MALTRWVSARIFPGRAGMGRALTPASSTANRTGNGNPGTACNAACAPVTAMTRRMALRASSPSDRLKAVSDPSSVSCEPQTRASALRMGDPVSS